MNGFLLEKLGPVGWRRESQIYWRFEDASTESERLLAASEARAVRILILRVNPDAIAEKLKTGEVPL